MWDKIVALWHNLISGESLTIILFFLPIIFFTGVIVLATLWKDYAQKISIVGKKGRIIITTQEELDKITKEDEDDSDT